LVMAELVHCTSKLLGIGLAHWANHRLVTPELTKFTYPSTEHGH
jgi:hypothetical protein